MVRTREQIEVELNEIPENIKKACDAFENYRNMSDKEWNSVNQKMMKEGQQADEKWIEHAKRVCADGGAVGNIDDPELGIIGHLREVGAM